MISRLIYILLAFSLIVQLSFSIYFSNEIISQNKKYQENTNNISETKRSIEILENQYSQTISLNNISRIATQSGLTPINQTIDLNHSLP